jgi:polyisoprenoid-binding protein YceI
MKSILPRLLISAAALIAVGPVFAAWTLDNETSQVSFVSVKAGDIAEAHRFTQLSGELSADGAANVTIQLASVDTLIPIRDERMREMLFNTNMFPTATLTANIDMADLKGINVGDSKTLVTEVMLNLNGKQVALTADVSVGRLGDSTLLVASRKPVILNAASVDLVDGIEALREIAGLPSISKAVPVSFVLTFIAAGGK